MDSHKRHVFIWKFLGPLIRLFMRVRYGYRYEKASVPGPFLLVCNHNTDLDPLMIGCSFRQQMYFIASEHLVRAGFGGRLVRWLQDPIPRQKGGSASSAVLTALRRLKNGYNVAFFPEGNRSWDGVTGTFPAATGKMARSAAAAGATLVTYRLDGAYFTSPRWAGKRVHKGLCTGAVVNTYSPDELRAMTPAQINEVIARDIFVDDYALQREKRISFGHRNLAEHMETLFFICPKCGAHSTLRSSGDTVRCTKCDLSVRYLPTGFLEGNIPWDNVRDWNLWQTEQLRALCENAGEEPILSDTEMELYDVETGKKRTLRAKGGSALYRDRLELPGVTLPLEEIRGISVRGDQDLYIGTDRDYYLLRSDEVRCVLRYLTAVSMLTGQDFGV